MLKKLQKRNSQGFTIIEVMIVLAIAALILLIVLLAVPALQRNSRNTQRKNDVSALTSATTEFVNNNNGTLPQTASGTGTVRLAGPAASPGAASNASVGFYNGGATQQNGCASAGTAGHVYLVTTAGTCGALTADSAHDYVAIVINGSCDTANAGATTATARSVAVQYVIESAGGYTAQCQGS